MLISSYSDKQLNGQYLTPKNNLNQKKIAFKGILSSSALNKAAEMSKSSIIPMFISTAVMMLIRPPIIMSDKDTPKSDRIFTASWMFALSAAALAVFGATVGPINKLSEKIALKAFNLPKQGKGVKDVFETLYKNQTTKKGLEAVRHAHGLTQVLAFFGLGVIVSNVNTLLVTRYLERGMNKISQKLWGRTATGKPEKPETPEEKAKRQKTDKIIAGTLLSIGSLTAIHLISKRSNGSSMISEALSGIYKPIGNILHINQMMSSLGEKLRNSCEHNQKGWKAKWLEKLAPEIDKNTLAELELHSHIKPDSTKRLDSTLLSPGVNMITRPLILVPAQQYYSAVNATSSEGLCALSTLIADKHVKKILPAMRTFWGANPNSDKEKAGADFLTNQLVKNIGIIGIVMGFANNYISREFLNVYKKYFGNKNKTNDKTNNKTNKA